MSATLRSCILGQWYYKVLEGQVLPRLLKFSITPHQMTVAGTVLAVFVPAGYYLHPVVGLVFLLLSSAADSLDGLIARAKQSDGPFGAFLDSSLDRLSDALYLIGFWVLFLPLPGLMTATLLMFAALMLTVMISYLKARAEALSTKCRVGLMERGVRVLYMIAWCLLLIFWPQSRSSVLWGGLSVYLGLTLATVIQRFIHIQKQLLRG